MKLYYGILLFVIGQTLAWFQSNSGIIVTEAAEVEALWSIRFMTFCIGYLIFIPLTWYFLGEEMLTAKNGISFLLCVSLLLVQAFMK